jgi:pyruvate/2-oxoglutarate dehydrogenase complex dihydrolipoamide dehydrogenase (E3) component
MHVTDVEIKEVFQKNGSKFVSAAVNKKDGKIEVARRKFEAEELLMATGRKPNAGLQCIIHVVIHQ